MRPKNMKNFHFLVKSRLAVRTLWPIYRFLKILQAYAQLSCISVSNLTWFDPQVTELLLRNRASVNYAEFFRAPCRKNYALGRKMTVTFYDGLDELYHHAKFGEIELRAPAVGVKLWCLFTGRMPRCGKLPVLNLLTWLRLAVQNFTSIGAGSRNAAQQHEKFPLFSSCLTGANPLTDF